MSVVRESIGAAGLRLGVAVHCAHTQTGPGLGWTKARLAKVWQWPVVGTATLGQGMTGGADAGHEQGGSAAGAHGKARAW